MHFRVVFSAWPLSAAGHYNEQRRLRVVYFLKGYKKQQTADKIRLQRPVNFYYLWQAEIEFCSDPIKMTSVVQYCKAAWQYCTVYCSNLHTQQIGARGLASVISISYCRRSSVSVATV